MDPNPIGLMWGHKEGTDVYKTRREASGETTLSTPWYWTSSLQNWEKSMSVVYKPPSMGCSVTAAQCSDSKRSTVGGTPNVHMSLSPGSSVEYVFGCRMLSEGISLSHMEMVDPSHCQREEWGAVVGKEGNCFPQCCWHRALKMMTWLRPSIDSVEKLPLSSLECELWLELLCGQRDTTFILTILPTQLKIWMWWWRLTTFIFF